MKVFRFKKDDPIYKVFLVFEKIPKKYEKVMFDIDPENIFFKNKWWLKLILDKADQRNIKITFLIQNSSQESFLEKSNANYIFEKRTLIKKYLKIIYRFFVNDPKFLLWKYSSSRVFKAIFIWIEIIIVVWFIYWIYNMVVSKTDVYIQPNIQMKKVIYNFYIYKDEEKDDIFIKKRINFPYYTLSFEQFDSLKINTKDIKYLSKPSKWVVTMTNTTIKWISLKANSQFITDNWLLFRNKTWVYIPPRSEKWPWSVQIELFAEEKDIDNNIIGVRWNIWVWTNLYIKRLIVSVRNKEVVAQPILPFEWWSTNMKWEVTPEDIDILKSKLLEKFEKNTKNYIHKHLMDTNDKIPLFYSWFYWYDNIQYNIFAKPWEQTVTIGWDITWNLWFVYINKKSLLKWFQEYLSDRIVSIKWFLGWDETSLNIYELDTVIQDKLYMIPTEVNAIIWYDFTLDYNNILPNIKERIVWVSLEEAKKILLKIPYIAAVELKTTDTLNKVSNLKSRIFIHIVE